MRKTLLGSMEIANTTCKSVVAHMLMTLRIYSHVSSLSTAHP